MNYNFVITVPIFKIRNSAESYCLAELQYSSQNSLILLLFFPPPCAKSNFIHQRFHRPGQRGNSGREDRIVTVCSYLTHQTSP